MSQSYTKLVSSLTASSVWCQNYPTRIMWVTMLAMCDANGCVYASIPGLARIANVSRDECEKALECFLSPDPDSRTPDEEGRRISVIDGGWRLINHAKYRAVRDKAERAEYMRNFMADKREKERQAAEKQPPVSTLLADVSNVSNVSAELAGLAPPTPTPTPTPTPVFKEEKEQRALVTQIPESQPENVKAVLAMRAAGVFATKPSDPELLDAIAEGVTSEQLAEIAATNPDKPQLWIVRAARGRLKDAKTNAASPRASPSAPRKSNAIQPSAPGTYGEDDPLPGLLQ